MHGGRGRLKKEGWTEKFKELVQRRGLRFQESGDRARDRNG